MVMMKMMLMIPLGVVLGLLCTIATAKYNETLHRISPDDPAPKLFIIGAQKCATSSLYDLLVAKHPNICVSKVKEIHYFDRSYNWERGSKFYFSHFYRDEECNKKLNKEDPTERTYYMDATPDYFPNSLVPKLIYESYGPILRKLLKFILILREPAAREFSLYNHRAKPCTGHMRRFMQKHKAHAVLVERGEAEWDGHQLCSDKHCTPKCHLYAKKARLGHETEAIANFTQFYEDGDIKLMKSEYAERLTSWLNLFDRNQFFIVNWQTLINNTTDTLERMNTFLGIPQFPSEVYSADHKLVLPRDNAAQVNTTFDCSPRMKLYDYYAPHNQKLYALLRENRRNDSLEPHFPEFEVKPCIDGQLF